MDLAYLWGWDRLEGMPLWEETEAQRWVHQAGSTNSRCQPRRLTRLSRQKLLHQKGQLQHQCYLQVCTDLLHHACLSPPHPLVVFKFIRTPVPGGWIQLYIGRGIRSDIYTWQMQWYISEPAHRKDFYTNTFRLHDPGWSWCITLQLI